MNATRHVHYGLDEKLEIIVVSGKMEEETEILGVGP